MNQFSSGVFLLVLLGVLNLSLFKLFIGAMNPLYAPSLPSTICLESLIINYEAIDSSLHKIVAHLHLFDLST